MMTFKDDWHSGRFVNFYISIFNGMGIYLYLMT